MELSDIPIERDGEYLCTISSFESLPLVPHKSSSLITSIVGCNCVSLCFRKSLSSIVYFTPCVKLSEKIYRRARETDSELYLVLSKKSICLPSTMSLIQNEYYKLIKPCFLLYDTGCFYLSSVQTNKIHKITKEIYQNMKRSLNKKY